jgi:peptidoglycan/LPS O-acetylase OafA/YrhL
MHRAVASLDNPTSRYLGRISYSLYVIHYPILLVVDQRISFPNTESVLGRELTNLIVAVPIVLITAHICRRLIEEPFIAVGRALSRRASGVQLHPLQSGESG